MKPVILGGGIAGLSLAYFLEGPSVVLEKEERLGGLSRSFSFNGVPYDVGPHIMFSKDREILDLHTSLVETDKVRRSNQIFYKRRLVKYPFENDLAALPPQDRDFCLNAFLENPHEGRPARNMLEFFLKTFGEGITRLYLQPYNEKIWKFDPARMDLQMVERIPKPPKEDIVKSANGVPTEGYLHQLYFRYPKRGGFQSLVDAYAREAAKKAQVLNPVRLERLRRQAGVWTVDTDRGSFETDALVNCMPLHELFRYLKAPESIRAALDKLLFNSIHIVVVQAAKDAIGEHFALYFPDRETAFHRVSKLDFLGPAYRRPGATTLLAEVTFRPGEPQDGAKIGRAVVDGLESQGLVRREDVLGVETRTFHYAYVIYDLDHRKNTDAVLGWLREQGIRCCGRFAEFEYMNSDAVAASARRLARELKK